MSAAARYLNLAEGRPAYDDAGTLGVRAGWMVQRPGSELLLLDGAGPLPHAEYLDDIAAALARFVQRMGVPVTVERSGR